VGGRHSALEDLVTAIHGCDPDFWRGRRVLVTGHTGFKGAWACLWLRKLGAEVHGFALEPEGELNLWRALGGGLTTSEALGDLRDLDSIRGFAQDAQPELVLHMAAQALVRRSYSDPVGTIAVNVLGTAHLLESLRGVSGLRAILVVTTDKVYSNSGGGTPFREGDPLGGADPYSSSKASAELIARGFAASFLEPAGVAVATARAGNVIGGGDWAEDRLVPDLYRAARGGERLRLRAPESTRPWQHVLDPLAGYFRYIEALAGGRDVPRALNFGPSPGDSMKVAELAEAMSEGMGAAPGWERDRTDNPPEAKTLALDSSLARETLGWMPRLSLPEAAKWTARWYAGFAEGLSARSLCEEQIADYEALP
jgi:CDP-glucose 4,6-dehydratase